MRKLIYTLLLFALFTPWSSAQEISEGLRTMAIGTNNALILELPDSEPKLIEKWWKEFIRDYKGKNRKVKGGDEYLSEDAEIPGLGNGNPIDVYAMTDASGPDVVQTVWFDLGGAYLNSDMHYQQFKAAEDFLQEFAVYAGREKVNLELDAEEKALKDLETELRKLEQENTRLHQDIENAERIIAESKTGLEENAKAQDMRKQAIEEQQKRVEEVKKRLKDFKK